MKYFIVGFNSSGKQQIVDDLKKLNVRIGQIFRSREEIDASIYSLSSIVYSNKDIDDIFENHAYVFMTERQDKEPFFEGLSTYEYENNDVFMITPDQFSLVPKFDSDVCFVWLDNNYNNRRARYLHDKRKYNFQKQDDAERVDIQDFIDRVYDNDVLYFVNEDPARVAAIIYSLITYPELHELYKNRFKE